MQSNELLELAKKVLCEEGYITKELMEEQGFGTETKRAWNKFCYSVPGMRFYAGRVPSIGRIPEDKIEALKARVKKEEPKPAPTKAPEPVKAPEPEVKKEEKKASAKPAKQVAKEKKED